MSVHRIERFPPDRVKIDPSLVRGLPGRLAHARHHG